jgi:hypothetical protein
VRGDAISRPWDRVSRSEEWVFLPMAGFSCGGMMRLSGGNPEQGEPEIPLPWERKPTTHRALVPPPGAAPPGGANGLVTNAPPGMTQQPAARHSRRFNEGGRYA